MLEPRPKAVGHSTQTQPRVDPDASTSRHASGPYETADVSPQLASYAPRAHLRRRGH